MFAVFAFGAGTLRVGLTVAIVLYAPIVAYRLVPALLAGGRYSIAVGATAVEAFMLVGAVALFALSAGRTG